MNQTVVIGNVGRDPEELRYSAAGLAILKFSLADTSGRDDNKKTSWYDVVVFGDKAENTVEHIRKGDRLIVVGKFQVEDYEAKDGTKKRRVSLIADEIGRAVKGRVKDQRIDPVDVLKQEFSAVELEPEEPF